MYFENWLSQVKLGGLNGAGKRGGLLGTSVLFRNVKRRRRSRRNHMTPAVILTESLETRVLLTTTDPTASDAGSTADSLDGYTSDSSSQNALDQYGDSSYAELSGEVYDTSGYFETLADSPVADSMGGYEEELADYSSSTGTMTSDAYGTATESQTDGTQAATGDSQDNSSTTDSTASDGTSTSGDSSGDSSLSESSQDVLDDMLGGTTDGDATGGDTGTDTTTGGDATATDAPPADPRFDFQPFQFPEEVQFEETTLPIQAFSDNLFAVTPEGTDSFATETTTTSTIDPSDGTDDFAPKTDLNSKVTLDQTWNSENDWTVQQSVTRDFNRTDVDATDGEDTEDFGRTGSETFSVTVVNGTTTITTYSISDTFTFSTGSIPGEEATEDPFAIPDDWVTNATTSVNTEESAEVAGDGSADSAEDAQGFTADTSGSGDGATGSDGSQTSSDEAAEEGEGTFFRTWASMSATVTETKVTMADGQPGIQHTFEFSFSAGFSWRTGGTWLTDQDEITAELRPDEEPLPTGMTIDAKSTWQAFASASIGGSFTASTTYAEGGSLLDLLAPETSPETSTSFHFGVGAMAGGSSSSTLKANLDESSGSETDGTDEYQKIVIDNSSTSSGAAGFSFWVGVSSDDNEQDAEVASSDATATDATAGDSTTGDSTTQFGTDSDAGNAQPTADETAASTTLLPGEARPVPGTQSASNLIKDKPSGAQFDLGISGSSNTSTNETFDIKERYDTGLDRGFTKYTSSTVASSSSEGHATIALGTEETNIDIGFSGQQSNAETHSSTSFNEVEYSEPGTYYADRLIGSYSETSSSFYDYGFAIAGEDPGVRNTSGYRVNISASEDSRAAVGDGIGEYPWAGYILEEIYRDHGGDPIPGEASTTDSGDGTSDSGVGTAVADATAANLSDADGSSTDDSPIHKITETFDDGGGNVTVTVLLNEVPQAPYDNGDRTLTEILDEYRARRENIARWEAARDAADDPAMAQYYQNLIDSETEILASVTTAALAAGATQSDLDTINGEAVAAAQDPNNQINIQEGESDFFDGSWFDVGVFASTFGGEVGAIGDGFAGIFYDMIGNDVQAQQYYASAYENGPLGLTANDDGIYYYGTRAMLGIATAATAAASSIIAWQAANGAAMYVFGVQGYNVTGHAALQAMNRGITYRMIHQAIGNSAMAQTAIYRGAIQTVFNGVNGVSVPVTIGGRFAGFIRTVFYSANRSIPFWPSL